MLMGKERQRCCIGNSVAFRIFEIFMMQEVKNTANTVILVSSGTISGKRSRQVAQSELYARSLARFGGIMLLDGGFGSVETLADRADALLLSGGGDIHPSYYGRHMTGKDASVDQKRDEREWELLRQFCARKKPVFGICRGLQVIDVFFGGTLFQQLATAYVHENTIHTIITSEDGWLRPLLGETVPVNSYHHQAIRTLGAGLRVTAVSDADGVIEAVEHDSLPVRAVQWHPERMVDGLCRDTDAEMGPLFADFLSRIPQEGTG